MSTRYFKISVRKPVVAMNWDREEREYQNNTILGSFVRVSEYVRDSEAERKWEGHINKVAGAVKTLNNLTDVDIYFDILSIKGAQVFPRNFSKVWQSDEVYVSENLDPDEWYAEVRMGIRGAVVDSVADELEGSYNGTFTLTGELPEGTYSQDLLAMVLPDIRWRS